MPCAAAAAHGARRRNAHARTGVVGIDAGAEEIELPAGGRLLLDQRVQVVPAMLRRGVLVPVGLDADDYLRRLSVEGLFDGLDGLVGGVDQGGRGTRVIGGGVELFDVADRDGYAHFIDAAAVELDEREVDRRCRAFQRR